MMNQQTRYWVIGTQNGQEVMGIPGNVLGGASTGVKGNSVSHDEHTITSSVIGDNVTINTGSTTGQLSRDPELANGYIKDQFDASQINSNFALQNQATQVINNYAGLGINAVATANNKAEQTQKDEQHKFMNEATKDNPIANMFGNNAIDQNDDFSLINKGNASALTGGLSAIGGAIIGGGNVGTTTAGVAGGLAGNALYNEAFPKDRPLGQDKNPLDPKQVNKDTIRKEEFSKDKTSNSNSQQIQNTDNKNVKYDDQTDLNKVGSSLIKDGVVGGLGALAGILTGGNIAIDTTTGGLTGLTMKPLSLKKKADQNAINNKVKPNTSINPVKSGDKK